MPSYFVSVMAEENQVQFVFDSDQICGENWVDVSRTIFEATNKTLANVGKDAVDINKMRMVSLSRL